MNEDITSQIAQVEAMDQARDLESGTRRLEAEGAEVARLNGKLGEALGEAQRLREHLADAVEAYDREVEAHASTTRLLTAARLDAHEQREVAERMTGNFDEAMTLGRWLLAESEWKLATIRERGEAAATTARELRAELASVRGEAGALRAELSDTQAERDEATERVIDLERGVAALSGDLSRVEADRDMAVRERKEWNDRWVQDCALAQWLCAEQAWHRRQAEAALEARTPEWYASVRDSLSAIAEATGYGSTDLSGLPEHVAEMRERLDEAIESRRAWIQDNDRLEMALRTADGLIGSLLEPLSTGESGHPGYPARRTHWIRQETVDAMWRQVEAWRESIKPPHFANSDGGVPDDR